MVVIVVIIVPHSSLLTKPKVIDPTAAGRLPCRLLRGLHGARGTAQGGVRLLP